MKSRQELEGSVKELLISASRDVLVKSLIIDDHVKLGNWMNLTVPGLRQRL